MALSLVRTKNKTWGGTINFTAPSGAGGSWTTNITGFDANIVTTSSRLIFSPQDSLGGALVAAVSRVTGLHMSIPTAGTIRVTIATPTAGGATSFAFLVFNGGSNAS